MWKDETTLLKMHAQLASIKKTKNNITNTLCSLKSSLNLLIEINKQQTANEQGYPLSWFIFSKSEDKQQVCYLKTSATSFYNNAYKNSLNSDAMFLILHSGDGDFFRSEPPVAHPVQRSHSRLNFQMKPFVRWTVF